MAKLRTYGRMYVLFQLENIRSLAQYRTDFFLMIFFTAFSQACSLGLIGIIYSNVRQVGGWTMWEIFLLYGFLLFSEGCINFFFQGAWKITNMIHTADLDRFLLRPLPVGLQLLTAKIDFDGLNKMTLAAAVLFLGFYQCSVRWDAGKVGLCFLFLLEACVIRVCMVWIASCFSFWMEGKKNSLNFFMISLGEMAKYPLCIYPPLLQGIFGYLIPYAFVSYYPIGYLLEKEGTTAGVVIMPGICAGMLFLSWIILRYGLKHYESCNY